MTTAGEIADQFAIARAMLELLQERSDAGDNPEAVSRTLEGVIGSLRNHGLIRRASKKPRRGAGYDFDDAQIDASLPDHDGILKRAIEAYYPETIDDEDERKKHERRIREHRRVIEAASTPPNQPDLLFEDILKFPHATRDIAGTVADEFRKFGSDDAARRGISSESWLWLRSRFLAGFR